MFNRSFLLYSLVLVLGLLSESLAGQHYDFTTIGLEQGMPNSRVNDLFQDSRGIYWIATEGNGLVRYDGHDFKSYTPPTRTSRLFMSQLEEDKNGRIWIALEHGILLFDGYSQREFSLPDTESRVKLFTVWKDDQVLVADQQGQLWVLNAEGSWKKLEIGRSIRINDLKYLDGITWLASPQGLFKLKEGNWSQADSLPVKQLQLDDQGQLHALADSSISTYTNTGKLTQRREVFWTNFWIDERGTLALASSALIVEDLRIGNLILKEANGLPPNNYKGCYRDHSGVIWLYSDKGLVKLESLGWKFYDYPAADNPQVFSVFSDAPGTYTVGLSSGYGQISDNGVTEYTAQSRFPFGLTLSIARYGGALWLGTEQGLVRKTGSRYTQVETGAGGDFVFTMKATPDKLWLGMGSGIFSYANGKVTNVSERESLPPATIFSISEGADGSLWCGTYTQGFYRYYEGQWQVLKELNGVRLDSLRFSCFAAGNASEIWAGSIGEGIFHFSKQGVEHITPEDLGFAEVRSMVIAANGSVWAGTNKGVMEIRKGAVPEIISLPYQPRLGGMDCTPQAIDIIDNQLLVGTTQGLQVLNLEDYQKPRPQPRIMLTDVKMFLGQNTSLPEYANDSLPFSLVPSEVQLPHDMNFLSFNLAGLTAYQNENLRYRYRLKGQSQDWAIAGSRREAIFSNIKPGEYIFEAQVSRYGEPWGTGIEYPFEILRPFWLRWWFITLLVLFVGVASFLFIRDRVRRANQRLRLENALLEMERKALRLQMNPHFIFNALDSISSFIFRKDPEKAVRYLNNFAKLMRLTLESSMEHLHPVETEVSILKNYLELEKLRFQGKFDYQIDLDEEIDYDVGIPPMLIQPHVENAILHGLKPLKDSGKLDIRFILNEDLLIIEVEDNGIGRKKAKELNKRKDHRSMATQINRDRLRLLRTSMSDKVDISIIDKVSDKGEAAGTKVIIKLPAESI